MEGVGARLGRSSTRYGPTTVFSGPVRKWKKRWVHVNPSSNHNSFHSHHHNATTNAAAAASSSATNHSSSSNGNNGSHLLLYKWTPLSQSNGSSSTTNHYNGTNINTTNENANLSNGDVTEEPPRRKFKYIPVDLIERQKKEAEEQEEASEKFDDESKPSDSEPHAAEPVSKSDSADEKPDINDVAMEENQDGNQVVRQDLNESTLDLSLGLVS